MKSLRAILIVFLAIAIPLPAMAASFGAPPCMEMSGGEMAEMEQAATHEHVSEADQQNDCGCGQCDDCVACDAPCATGSTATFNNTSTALALLPLQDPRATMVRARALPAHPEDLIRPPALTQS